MAKNWTDHPERCAVESEAVKAERVKTKSALAETAEAKERDEELLGKRKLQTVSEVSRLAGISVRTLHHYDKIGLLKPTETTAAGYRLYDDAALRRLQSILMFRELQFPLKEIQAILASPSFDPSEALEQQIRLLELQRSHIDKLISLARRLQMDESISIKKDKSMKKDLLEKGADKMNFDAFDKTEIHQYAEEVRERWGSTQAFREYEEKTKEKSSEALDIAGDKMMMLFAEIGSLRRLPPSDGAVQAKIKELQAFITDNYYNCTDEILQGLGQMYVCDERMKRNIDKAGGDGTAEFVRQAVEFLVR